MSQRNKSRIITGDGSPTFYSVEYHETYHSVSGAKEEALRKYVLPAKIPEKALCGSVSILDVCMGFGYNSACAIDVIRDISPECRIRIVGLEKDRLEMVDPPFESYPIVRKALKTLQYNDQRIQIDLIIGRAEETIKSLNDVFDCVFHDPFSKNPELWTEEFFSQEFRLLRPGGRLTTFSCARVARDNMQKAGFIVRDGPKVGRRGPSTIAIRFK